MPRTGTYYRDTAPNQFLDNPDFGVEAPPDMVPANDQAIDVDLSDPALEGLPSTFEMDPLGDVIESQPEVDDLFPSEHDANLAIGLPEDVLQTLGEDIVANVEADIEERKPWRERFMRGLEMMGLVESDLDDGPFPGASNAIHPLLVEAVTQFWARALGELFPPEGPCKTKVHGNQTHQMLARAERVAEYMNFEMTTEDEGYIPEKSRMLWMLPLVGCGFSKTYRDPILDRNVTIYVPAEDMIVPAEATSLRTAPRFAHRMRKSPNEVLRLQLVGHYRDVDLSAPSMVDRDELDDMKNEAADVEPDDDEDTLEHEILEVSIDLDLPGHEHLDEETNEPTGLKLPYIVSIDKHSRSILSIYRNWDEDDPLMKRRVYTEKYGFVPGLGFYDFGIFHLIGGLQIAATGALRVLLDSAASASLSGGFVSKNANLKGQNLVTQPGIWQPVDATSEDMQKAFFPAPVKEPSAALFQLLGFLTQAAQRFTATTELMTGDQDPKGAPVGTTVAMIEQGGKVMSTIHRLIHGSLGRELRLRYELCRKYAPATGYPYEVAGEERTIYADDFSKGVEVVPVSDPNIFSSQQRLAVAQAVLQLSLQTGTIPPKVAAKRVLQAMKVPDIEELLPDDPQPQAYDAAGEIQAVLMNKPVMVMPEQPHSAHLQVWAAFMNNPAMGGNPVVMQQIAPAAMSIMGQHLAYALVTAAREQGVPAGYMDPSSGQLMPMPGDQQMLPPPGGPGMGQEGLPMDPAMMPPGMPQMGAPGQPMPNAGQPPMVPPEQVTMMLAQIAPALMQAGGVPPMDGGTGDQAKMQLEEKKLQMKAAEGQQKMAQEQEKHQLDMAREEQKLQFEQYKEQMKLQIEEMKAQAKMQIEQMKSEMQLQAAQQKAAIDQQVAAQQAQQTQQKMVMDQAMGEQQMVADAQMQQSQIAAQQRQVEQEGQLKAQQAQQDMAIQGQQATQDQQLKAQQAAPPAAGPKRPRGRGKLDGLR